MYWIELLDLDSSNPPGDSVLGKSKWFVLLPKIILNKTIYKIKNKFQIWICNKIFYNQNYITKILLVLQFWCVANTRIRYRIRRCGWNRCMTLSVTCGICLRRTRLRWWTYIKIQNQISNYHKNKTECLQAMNFFYKRYFEFVIGLPGTSKFSFPDTTNT